jgi:hypothetical protein
MTIGLIREPGSPRGRLAQYCAACSSRILESHRHSGLSYHSAASQANVKTMRPYSRIGRCRKPYDVRADGSKPFNNAREKVGADASAFVVRQYCEHEDLAGLRVAAAEADEP